MLPGFRKLFSMDQLTCPARVVSSSEGGTFHIPIDTHWTPRWPEKAKVHSSDLLQFEPAYSRLASSTYHGNIQLAFCSSFLHLRWPDRTAIAFRVAPETIRFTSERGQVSGPRTMLPHILLSGEGMTPEALHSLWDLCKGCRRHAQRFAKVQDDDRRMEGIARQVRLAAEKSKF